MIAWLGIIAVMTAFVMVESFTSNPWRLDLRKLMTAQWLFWLGLSALTVGAATLAVLTIGRIFA